MNSNSRAARPSIDTESIVSKLNSIVHVNDKNDLSFKTFGGFMLFEDLLTVLETSQHFDEEITEVERRTILRRAVRDAASRLPITSKNLATHIARLKALSVSSPLSDFVLATTLTIKPPPNLGAMKFDDLSFIFSEKLPRRFTRKNLEFPAGFRPPSDLPDGYLAVRVRVAARSAHRAVERAFDGLDFLRGLWNYTLNIHTWTRMGSHNSEPVNAIRLGPVHSLHKPGGELSVDTCWYEPTFRAGLFPKSLDDKWEHVERPVRRMREQLRRMPSDYRNSIRTAFIRYCRCLDSSDNEATFLKLWSLLEFLTNTLSDPYEKLIKRTLFLYEDEDERYHKSVLEHLRERRNGVIHSGKSSIYDYAFVFQAKRYVERLLWFHLRNVGRFKSKAEAGAFLDSPRDRGSLRSKLGDLEKALRFRDKMEGDAAGR